MEQDLLTLLEHMGSPPVYSGVRVTRSLVLCVCFVFVDRVVCSFVLFLLAIVLSVLRFTDSFYPFGICKLFLRVVASNRVDHGFEHWSEQIQDYKIGICCFSAKHAVLRSKNFSMVGSESG